MTRLLQVEYFKLRKRMMTWILAAILVGLVVLLYSVLWSVSGRVTTFGDRNRFTGADLRRALFLQASVPFSLQIVAIFGSILAMILASGAAGSEYAWGTVRLTATAASGRLRLIAAKLIVVFAMIIAGAVLAVAVGLALSSLITVSNGGADFSFVTRGWVGHQFAATGRTLFVMMPYVTLAYAAAIIGRSTLAGVGAGIGSAFIEPIASNLMRLGTGFWHSVPNFLLNANVQVIMAQNSLPEVANFGPSKRELASRGANSVAEAAIILALYTVGFITLAFAVYRRRDITAGTG